MGCKSKVWGFRENQKNEGDWEDYLTIGILHVQQCLWEQNQAF